MLGTATLEEFLDLIRVYWFVRPLVYILMLAGVIRLRRNRRLPGAGILIVGFSLLLVGDLLGVASEKSWIELGYSPSYAAMMREWELGVGQWAWWEPVYWWLAFVLGRLGFVVAAAGFVVSGRGIARSALERDWAGGEPIPED